MATPSNEPNARPLLEWLLRRHPDTPRSRAKEWILAGRVSINGVILRRPNQTIPDPGTTLELHGRRLASLACGSGWQIHPRIALLYLDSALAIVNKGPGLISVPAANGPLSALSILADFLAGKIKARRHDAAGQSLPSAYRGLRPLPVHRLDQYTSGLFCMAMNSAARSNLIEQLNAHTMNREYVAFVEGRANARNGVWRQWLHLSRDELRQHVISEPQAKAAGVEAREAITHYEVIAEYRVAGGSRFITKLRLRLETGRKHQIRVQAANAGLPLVGDRTYNPAMRGQNTARLTDFPRQALHATVLTLEHPEQPGKRMSWTAELPDDLRQLEADLHSGRL
jgi:23S rRNA pseudouridine1911/1915/1917 synthase